MQIDSKEASVMKPKKNQPLLYVVNALSIFIVGLLGHVLNQQTGKFHLRKAETFKLFIQNITLHHSMDPLDNILTIIHQTSDLPNVL